MPRGYTHDYIPTYASWLNQVERWFGLITQRYNEEAKPFVWAATAQSILDKLERLSIRISGTPH